MRSPGAGCSSAASASSSRSRWARSPPTYPTAGGLYFWASRLGSPAWGWFTGWFNLVGQIAVTAAIGYGCAIFTTSLLNLLFDYPNSHHVALLHLHADLIGAGLINLFGVPITAMLNTFSAWWHMVGVLVIVGS